MKTSDLRAHKDANCERPVAGHIEREERNAHTRARPVMLLQSVGSHALSIADARTLADELLRAADEAETEAETPSDHDQYERMIRLLADHQGKRIGEWEMAVEGGGAAPAWVVWYHRSKLPPGSLWVAAGEQILRQTAMRRMLGLIVGIACTPAEAKQIASKHNEAIEDLDPTPKPVYATPFWEGPGIPLQWNEGKSTDHEDLTLTGDDAGDVARYFLAMSHFLTEPVE
jgi:hypothetical protein